MIMYSIQRVDGISLLVCFTSPISISDTYRIYSHYLFSKYYLFNSVISNIHPLEFCHTGVSGLGIFFSPSMHFVTQIPSRIVHMLTFILKILHAEGKLSDNKIWQDEPENQVMTANFVNLIYYMSLIGLSCIM